MARHYFPQGIATNDAFCNREIERAALKSSIKAHEHVVLVAPRRYGKTSLITQVLKENEFVGASIDFFFVLTQGEVNKSLSDGVSQIITALLPKTKLACNKLIDSMRACNPKLTFNFLGQKLEINTKQTTEKSISELLLALDQFAEMAKKSCVVVFDEFQQIGELKENHAVEASIRHAVERSQHVSYIFCGSNRHLLNEMFSDKSRPLYHLCDLMTIERIKADCYYTFLNKMAKKKWQAPLSDDVIGEIMHLTENHPYYTN
ncbi:MAG TPA: ATP-binding protein, partial [Gammaproteobacteria bacterium]|nr:ATP-binding protein [Gammaproteobacteria bacterium]